MAKADIAILGLIGLGAFLFYSSSKTNSPSSVKKNDSNYSYNPTATLENIQPVADHAPTQKADSNDASLTNKQQQALEILQAGRIPINAAGAIIADTIYNGKPVKSQSAFEQNIAVKYGEATPIERTADPLTSIITLVGGQTTTVGRSPSSDAEKYQARRANLNTFSESDKQTESYKKADAKLKALGY